MADDAGDKKDPETTDARSLILGGLGIGAFGVISAVVGGAVCPVCVVAAPALVGVGVYKRWRSGARKAREEAPPSDQGPAAQRSKAG